MASRRSPAQLSRRERQILDVLYQRGASTAAEIQAGLPASPSYSAVRALLRILEDKGHIKHQERGARYVYTPKVSRQKARRSALAHMIRTFFDGSAEQAMTALLDASAGDLSEEELDRLAELIAKARKEGR
jgi:BlaI family transcriptional regulator, penicillinase repressor